MATNNLVENEVVSIKNSRQYYSKLPMTLSGTSANLAVGGNLTVIGTRSGGATAVTQITADTTLTAAQSGTILLFNVATGAVVTLPTPSVGLTYTFVVLTTVTSNSYKVITNTGTVFMQGSLLLSSNNLASKSFLGDGATHLAVTQAAASSNATGGILGGEMTVRCMTATEWQVSGILVASATPTTPFATS